MIVKVCGLRGAAVAEAAVAAGADWVGIVFEPRSPRHATAEQADEVIAAVAGRACVIGVLVAPSPARCAALAARHRLDALQLHGDVDPGSVTDLPLPVIRGINAGSAEAALRLQWWPDGLVLLDAAPEEAGALPGGTGRALDWEVAAEVQRHRPVILAGGLDPGNVAAAVRRVAPLGVDASSGLESAPGIKDVARVRAYVAAARAAAAVTRQDPAR